MSPFDSVSGQARLLSATPGSLDDKKDATKPEGFMKRFMGKDSCVVRINKGIAVSVCQNTLGMLAVLDQMTAVLSTFPCISH